MFRLLDQISVVLCGFEEDEDVVGEENVCDHGTSACYLDALQAFVLTVILQYG